MHYLRSAVESSLTFSEIAKLQPAFFDDEIVVGLIRTVVMRCWITTPKENQTVAEVRRQVNCIVETALRQLEEDLAEINADRKDQ